MSFGIAEPMLGMSALLFGVCCYAASGWDRSDVMSYIGWAEDVLANVLAFAVEHMGSFARAKTARCGCARVDSGEVAEMIDIVNLGLSAGLSFDAALELYCGGKQGVLPRDLARAELMWRVGARTREEALEEVARRHGLRALEAFASSVVQSIALGAPLTDALSSRSSELRAERRAEVERSIERAPVRLLIPTATLVLPALLISIMGPLMAAAGMV